MDLCRYLRQSMSVLPLGPGWWLRDVLAGLRWWWRDHGVPVRKSC